MTDYMHQAREMSCDEDGELSVFQALGNLARTLESLDKAVSNYAVQALELIEANDRAEKAEQRERELREFVAVFANDPCACGVMHGVTKCLPCRARTLIQPEPDPLVEAIEAMRQTAKELRECPNRDCNLVMQAIMWEKRAADVEARLSIVKGES